MFDMLYTFNLLNLFHLFDMFNMFNMFDMFVSICFMHFMCIICFICLKFKAWTRVIALQTLEGEKKTLSVHVLCVLLKSIKFYGIECLIFNTHIQ